MRLISRWTMAAYSVNVCKSMLDEPMYRGTNYEKIARDIAALGDSPNPDELDRLVGHSDWTSPGECCECGGHPDELVMIGKQDEDAYGEVALCAACVLKALILIDQ